MVHNSTFQALLQQHHYHHPQRHNYQQQLHGQQQHQHHIQQRKQFPRGPQLDFVVVDDNNVFMLL